MSADETVTAEGVLASLRNPARVRMLLRGFAPLVLAAVLFVLMVVFAPSVAPERVIERPVQTTVVEEDGG